MILSQELSELVALIEKAKDRYDQDIEDDIAYRAQRIMRKHGRALASAVALAEGETLSQSFQQRVQPWMLECFNAEIAADVVERGDRLLEETLELLQSGGYDQARVAALRDYVWSRPVGEPSQEVGGVMVTLAAYCLATGIDMHAAGETELVRILQPEVILKIRAKQATKKVGSALPINKESA
jgi:hypothetical protein